MGTIFTFQWRSLSTPLFHATLLQAIAGVVSLALCLHIVPQAPSFWDASHLWWLLCPLVCLTGHFPWQWPVLGGTSTSFSKDGVKHWRWNPTRSYIVSCSGRSLQAQPGSFVYCLFSFPSLYKTVWEFALKDSTCDAWRLFIKLHWHATCKPDASTQSEMFSSCHHMEWSKKRACSHHSHSKWTIFLIKTF